MVDLEHVQRAVPPKSEIHDVRESPRNYAHGSSARIHAVDLGAADREGKARKLADVVLPIGPQDDRRGNGLHRNIGTAERVGHQAVGEHGEIRDASPGPNHVNRVPASATTKRQRSKRTSTGLESTAGLPTAASGLTSRSNAQRSAILRIFPGRGISSSRPKRSATGFSAASASREIVAPIGSLGSVGPPLVTKTWSLPSTVMPCGPIALSLFGVFAYEASFDNPRLAPPATDLGHCPRRPCTRDPHHR